MNPLISKEHLKAIIEALFSKRVKEVIYDKETKSILIIFRTHFK